MNVFQWSEVQIFTFFFIFLRISSIIVFLPIFGDKVVPSPVKVLFSLAFSMMVFPIMWNRGYSVDMAQLETAGGIVWIALSDLGFGMLLGYAARWIFDAVSFGGYIAGTSMGFSIATVMDPSTESHTIAYAKLKYVMASLLFLGLNGHHMYLTAVLHSFDVIPIGGANFTAQSSGVISYLVHLTSEVFILGVKFAAPIMIVILLVNIAFGIMARAVPQMNVLIVSFTANILFGLFAAAVSFPGFVNMVESAFDVYTPELFRFIDLFTG